MIELDPYSVHKIAMIDSAHISREDDQALALKAQEDDDWCLSYGEGWLLNLNLYDRDDGRRVGLSEETLDLFDELDAAAYAWVRLDCYQPRIPGRRVHDW